MAAPIGVDPCDGLDSLRDGVLKAGVLNAKALQASAESHVATLAAQYRIGRLFVERRQPLFGHPLDEAARATGLPLAFRDWSAGVPGAPASIGLAIAPRASPDEAARAVARWMT